MGWTGDYSHIRDEFVDEAMTMANHGVVSLLVSGYFPWYVTPTDKDADRMAMICQIRELRRALDLLLDQPGVDPSRIAFVGHSMGAMHGADLVAVDHRIKAAVLMAPHATLTDWVFEGYGLDASTEPGYRAAMASFDPIAFVPHANPTALFFEFGGDDSFVPRNVAQALYEAASEPKKIGWYGGGHDLDEKAQADRTAWLTSELNLTS
jgi:predicted esterase